MKLQKHIASIVKGKEYSKWVIVIPSSQIDKLGWNEGADLESTVKNEILIIKRRINPPEKPQKMTYEEFKGIIKEELEKEPKGLSWTEIKERRTELYQKVPNNLWVRTLEREIGLTREKVGTKTIWRIA